MGKAEEAKELFLSGANCAQAVVGAFAEECGLDKATAMKLACGFGAGMGRMREVCGAVSGAIMVAGLKHGNTDLNDKEAKDATYALVQKIAARFKEGNGSIICRELLGLAPKQSDAPVSSERTKEYYRKRPCADIVALAAKIVEEEIGK